MNETLTVADAMELKTGDFVEVGLGRTWHRVQLVENPSILYRNEDDTEKTFAVLYLSGNGIVVGGRYEVPTDSVRMDGYFQAVLKEEIVALARHQSTEPFEEDAVDGAVKRIMERMGLWQK